MRSCGAVLLFTSYQFQTPQPAVISIVYTPVLKLCHTMTSSLTRSTPDQSEADETLPTITDHIVDFLSGSMQEVNERYSSEALEHKLYSARRFSRATITVREDETGYWAVGKKEGPKDPDVANVLMVSYNPTTCEIKHSSAYTQMIGPSHLPYVEPAEPISRTLIGFDDNGNLESALQCHNLSLIDQPDPNLFAGTNHNKAYICDLYEALIPFPEDLQSLGTDRFPESTPSDSASLGTE